MHRSHKRFEVAQQNSPVCKVVLAHEDLSLLAKAGSSGLLAFNGLCGHTCDLQELMICRAQHVRGRAD